MRRIAALASAVLALAVAGCVAVPAAPAITDGAATATSFPANMASHGFVQTDEGFLATQAATATPAPTDDVGDRVHVVVYVDLLCPFCAQFEDANGAMLAQAVADGDVALETHPISFLDRLSQGTEYSTRAANLVAAVADLHPDAVPGVLEALWAQQPAEGTEGLDDAELLRIAEDAGASSQELADAVEQVAYRPFVEAATQAATTTPLPGQPDALAGTPTVLVDGEPYAGEPGDAATFQQLVEDAIAS